MKILLINHNPVVSRLTSLSAKKEKVELDEIKELSSWKEQEYDVVFIDSESYTEEIAQKVKNTPNLISVFFYAQGEEAEKELFDHAILKPFLPSEVSTILRETKIALHQAAQEATEAKEESIEELPSVNFEELNEPKSEPKEEPELPELDPIPSQPDKEESFDLKLEEAFPSKKEEEELNKPEEPTLKEEALDLDLDLFEEDTQQEKDQKEDQELFELDKEIKESIIQDEALDLDLESKEEINLDEAPIEAPTLPKKEEKETPSTKILDQDEVSNIKSLLADEGKASDESLTLDDILASNAPISPVVTQEVPQEQPKKEPKTTEENPTTQRNTGEVLLETIGKLPIEELRQLLRGATVNITIQFPNEP